MSFLSLNAEVSSQEKRQRDYWSWEEMQGAGEWRVSDLILDHSRCSWFTSHMLPVSTRRLYTVNTWNSLLVSFLCHPSLLMCLANNKAIWKQQGVPPRKQPLTQPTSLPLKWEDSWVRLYVVSQGAQQDLAPVAHSNHLLINVLWIGCLFPSKCFLGALPNWTTCMQILIILSASGITQG